MKKEEAEDDGMQELLEELYSGLKKI
jgi:hypothetical protein